jgi:CHAT domain-containing protein/Flp pilus assembly protein TadD
MAASLLAAYPASGQTRPDDGGYRGGVRPGAVLEEVARRGMAEKVGLQPGAILLTWSRADKGGKIESPFDLEALEIEEGPLGISLQGIQNGETKSWLLGAALWYVASRPDFAPDVLGEYQKSDALLKNAKPSAAVQLWHELGTKLGQEGNPRAGLWMLYHGAKALTEARDWKEADKLFAEVLGQAVGETPILKAQLLNAWSDSFSARDDVTNALKYAQLALVENQKVNPNSRTTAKNLSAVGILAFDADKLELAEDCQQQALAIRRKVAPGTAGIANVLEALGNIADRRSDLAKAEEYHLEALAIRQRLSPESRAVAASLMNLGSLYQTKGEFAKSEEYLLHALKIQEDSSNSYGVAYVLNNLGLLEIDLGNLRKAEEFERRAVEIKKKFDSGGRSTANSLGNLAEVLHLRGDFNQAEAYHLEAVALTEKLAPESVDLAESLADLGKLEAEKGDLEKAEKIEERALAIEKKLLPGSISHAVSLQNLGTLAFYRGELKRAEELYLEALPILQGRAPHSVQTVADLNALANVALHSGDFVAAEGYLKQGLADLENDSWHTTAEAGLLHSLGELAWRRGDTALAERHFRQALDIRTNLVPGTEPQAETLVALARVLRKQDRLNDAARLFEQAINALDGVTARLGGSEEIRAGYRASHESYFKEYIDLLIEQHRPDLALEVGERSRARIFLDMLAESHLNLHQGVDQSLVEREHELQALFRAKSQRRLQLLTQKHTDQQIKALDQELKGLLEEYETIDARVRATSPAYAAMIRPQPLAAHELQQLLDSHTLLVEYSLGKERSYVWVVGQNSLNVYELPKEQEIEDAARRLYKLLLAGSDERTNRSQRAAALAEATSALSRLILEPIRDELGDNRLLVVSDGTLQYIPFGALALPENEAKSGSHGPSFAPLLLHHEIVDQPSASILAFFRQQEQERTRPPKEVAILADPVFDDHDERVHKGALPRQPATSLGFRNGHEQWVRSVSDVRGASDARVYLPRLSFTRREANNIMELVPKGQGMQALDFEASRSKATSPELRQYRFVHIATHALLDSVNPQFSGVVLSLVDPHGEPQDGFLGLEDIYNLNLPVEMVVLSACETGLGKEISSEGMIGLTRGFMYAGATRVVASAWMVDDSATAELMAHFYKGMEHEKLAPAAALRQAQLQMWRQKRWNDPYYWAGFQIQGEWK